MLKTFKSAFEDSNYRLEVGKNLGAEHLSLWIVGRGLDSISIAIAPSDVPALSLATLEEAGYKEDTSLHVSPVNHFGLAMFHLRKGLEDQERVTAEAEAKEKLETEALGYWKAYNQAVVPANFGDVQWEDLAQETQAKWLAVARHVRENNKEDTND